MLLLPPTHLLLIMTMMITMMMTMMTMMMIPIPMPLALFLLCTSTLARYVPHSHMFGQGCCT